MEETQFLEENQPIVFTQLQKSFEHGRLAHAYLFEGEAGTGKHEASIWLAKHLFCTNLQAQKPCNQCNNCQRIQRNEHPDVQVIEPDGQTIKVDQIRNLQSEFSTSGFETKQKVFIIKDSDKMNSSAANSLLKFLEEPVGMFLAILETDSVGRILPTIQSRCQILHFQPLSKELLQKKLVENGIGEQSAKLLSSLTNSFDKAVEISQNEWFNEARESVQQWFNYLKEKDPQAFIYVQKKLIKVFKEKGQQAESFAMLLFFYQSLLVEKTSGGVLKDISEVNRVLELILQAEQKLSTNVSFQSTAEQLALRIIYR
ncbi:DNA polymerase III, delta subunit [Enterococcus phoeniculicola]|jgi:DNA polymerase-3 subunit delta'|uniref:DNA polymerase III, delta' subunit n=1 Tax=Enterococcus phoeniculicola ATCC BAA-412 TaxID=1158610 RepID=R3WLX6_9ENTE|nr:DNA polymerase III subunit delta' [Enterococcus phoeniculicola]EOL48846.1 DNA polymerase III, delta' subunit [Enterococcus phoeniculicola ATCC BAA-412]EOT72692.1 DNA polymerase III, delta' subunit [Enterococcus phoeniculicola ATCC BAA-412]OJG71968.1 DNA polymerase III, delta subunit [Enterococcus phoeniculicola]